METQWNAELYQGKHKFVWQFGEMLLDLLAPKPGEYILDLGCGTGQLTQQIAIAGADVLGIDRSKEMVDRAKSNYPHLKFDVADAKNFQCDCAFDAVFSNATLHWIKPPEAVIDSVYKSLKPGGRFVAEFGGKGNVKAIVQALELSLKELGYANLDNINPWYFPSVGEYTFLLEQFGFEVVYATLFDRPISLEGGEAGLRNWLEMFANGVLSKLSVEQQEEAIATTEKYLKPQLYENSIWKADYRRIRVVAIKN
ncbi:MAG: class I SAM-dependent methyltransferase [Xenococcaceae cyanobacterium]